MVWLISFLLRLLAALCLGIFHLILKAASAVFSMDSLAFLDLFDNGSGIIQQIYQDAFVPGALAVLLAVYTLSMYRALMPKEITGDEEGPLVLSARYAIGFFLIANTITVMRYINSFFAPFYSLVQGSLDFADEAMNVLFGDGSAGIGMLAAEAAAGAASVLAGVAGGFFAVDAILALLELILALVLGIPLFFNVFMMIKMLGFRYFSKNITELLAPLAFSTMGSKSTEDIAKAYIRFYIGNIFTMILSAFVLRLYNAGISNFITNLSATDSTTIPQLIGQYYILIGVMPFFMQIDQYVTRMGLSAQGNMRAMFGGERGGERGNGFKGATKFAGGVMRQAGLTPSQIAGNYIKNTGGTEKVMDSIPGYAGGRAAAMAAEKVKQAEAAKEAKAQMKNGNNGNNAQQSTPGDIAKAAAGWVKKAAGAVNSIVYGEDGIRKTDGGFRMDGAAPSEGGPAPVPGQEIPKPEDVQPTGPDRESYQAAQNKDGQQNTSEGVRPVNETQKGIRLSQGNPAAGDPTMDDTAAAGMGQYEYANRRSQDGIGTDAPEKAGQAPGRTAPAGKNLPGQTQYKDGQPNTAEGAPPVTQERESIRTGQDNPVAGDPAIDDSAADGMGQTSKDVSNGVASVANAVETAEADTVSGAGGIVSGSQAGMLNAANYTPRANGYEIDSSKSIGSDILTGRVVLRDSANKQVSSGNIAFRQTKDGRVQAAAYDPRKEDITAGDSIAESRWKDPDTALREMKTMAGKRSGSITNGSIKMADTSGMRYEYTVTTGESGLQMDNSQVASMLDHHGRDASGPVVVDMENPIARDGSINLDRK